METKIQAPAKVNLFLRMAGMREDGYHLLYSCMQTVSLYDEILVERVRPEEPGYSGEVLFTSNCEYLPSDPKKNTAVAAAVLFLKKTGETDHVRITLTKNIPSQAGLGGGSSDAAAVLRAMDQLFPGCVTEEELAEMALAIGADVPYLLKGGTALCEGVGEKLTPLPDLCGLPMLLIKPPKGVSTPLCYRKWDEMNLPIVSEEEKRELLSDLKNGKAPLLRLTEASEKWHNDLQDPALLLVPEIREGIEILSELGAVYTAMTGSGSCIFGFFSDKDAVPPCDCPKIAELIRRGWWVQAAETV